MARRGRACVAASPDGAASPDAAASAAKPPGHAETARRVTLARIMAATAVAGLCATACGGHTVHTGAGWPAPPRLRISGIAVAAAAGPRPAATTGARAPRPPGEPGSPRVELAGRLPAGGPSRGAVQQLAGGPAPGYEVRSLASALHMTGAPQRSGDGWRVTGPGILEVSGGPGRHWTYTGMPRQPCGGPIRKYAAAVHRGPGPVAAALTAFTCPLAGRGAAGSGPADGPGGAGGPAPGEPLPGSGSPGATGPPSPLAAESVAAPVLHAAGVTASVLRASVAGSSTSVRAEPAVQGMPTSGFTTMVQAGPSGVITAASGWLARPQPGPVYPLIGAARAAGALRPPASPAGRGGIAPVARVTGAVYGLALGYQVTGGGARPVLAPAWLVRLAGSAGPVPVVAVSPRYLAAG